MSYVCSYTYPESTARARIQSRVYLLNCSVRVMSEVFEQFPISDATLCSRILPSGYPIGIFGSSKDVYRLSELMVELQAGCAKVILGDRPGYQFHGWLAVGYSSESLVRQSI